MKKVLRLLIVFALSLVIFSLSFADYPANYAAPQLEYITNSFPGLWNRNKEDVLRMMDMFPDYVCTDYEDQIGCVSRFNTNHSDNIFLNFFMDDYEEHHDNLWKVAVTVDIQSAEQMQDLLSILWIAGMKPFHDHEDEFHVEGVVPLYFNNENTTMTAWFQPFKPDNGAFFLAEYYNGYMK